MGDIEARTVVQPDGSLLILGISGVGGHLIVLAGVQGVTAADVTFG